MANQYYANEFYDKAARTAISAAIVNQKANVCPFMIRLAWHASGTYDQNYDTTATATTTDSNNDETPSSSTTPPPDLNHMGGSNGATMRFAPEIHDPANAGLQIAQDILLSVKRQFPNMSYADLWTLAGCQAISLMGGPQIPFQYGRTDHVDGSHCPAHGRLPDAKLGADHLRTVFYRMGFTDRDIVALSGAHTVGSCHRLRSGFDGPWTTNPLKFDNEYYRNLLDRTWVVQPNSNPMQYMDLESNGKLMMLPTDMCLIQDENFLPYVKTYAADEKQFFIDFATAFSKLISLGCPPECQPSSLSTDDGKSNTTHEDSTVKEISPEMEFRDLAMHGSIERMKEVYKKHYDQSTESFDINSKEMNSLRTAMHKAAFFGHGHVIEYLCSLPNVQCNDQDVYGDTPLHDASRLGHDNVVAALLKDNNDTLDLTIQNTSGYTAYDVAKMNHKTNVMELLMKEKEARERRLQI